MGTNTDAYQRAEGRYRLMRGILEALVDHRNPFSILAKGTLIITDLDLLVRARRSTHGLRRVLDRHARRGVWRETEPGTPREARMGAVRQLTEAGMRPAC